MDNKDWTPEELELKEALNKLYATDTSKPPKPLDLSFMKETEKEKAAKRRRRLAYVAAAVLLVFVSSFTTAIFISNDYASAAKEQVKRKVFEMKHGVVVATDEEFAEEGETVWEITDFDTAVKAKELVPELPIPGYVPEGYEFEKLVLHLYEDRYVANYNYKSCSYEILINCQSSDESNFDSSMFNVVETLELPDRDIFVLQEPLTLTLICNIFYDSTNIILTCTDTMIHTSDLIETCSNIR